jgi:hypothetical protein
MPEDLQAHIRYPEDFFAIQARKYATYHMEDPQVFYNKEDLWAIPRRTIEGEREMSLHHHASARERAKVHLTLFNRPARHDRVAGARRPRTTATDRLISPSSYVGLGQVDLSDQPASRHLPAPPRSQQTTVIRGSRPFRSTSPSSTCSCLAAPSSPRVPVIVAYGNQIAMEPTLEQSLARMFGGRAVAAPAAEAPGPAAAATPGVSAAAQRAWEVWTRAQDALRRGDWAAYGAKQKRLEDALRSLLDPPATRHRGRRRPRHGRR